MTAQLRMRYELDDYDAWRTVFDRDPLDRRGSGATAHRISRDADNGAAVLVDLDFASLEQAEAFRDRLVELWKDPSMPTTAKAEVVLSETTEQTAY